MSPRLLLIVVVTMGTHCGELHESGAGDVWPIFSIFTHQGTPVLWLGWVLLLATTEISYQPNKFLKFSYIIFGVLHILHLNDTYLDLALKIFENNL